MECINNEYVVQRTMIGGIHGYNIDDAQTIALYFTARTV